MDLAKIEEITRKIKAIDEDKIYSYRERINKISKKDFKSVKRLFPILLSFYIDNERYADAVELANKYIKLSELNYRISSKNELKSFFNCEANIFKLPIYCNKAEQWDDAVARVRKKRQKRLRSLLAGISIILLLFILTSVHNSYLYNKFSSQINDASNIYANIIRMEKTLPFMGKEKLLTDFYVIYFKQLIKGPQYLDMYDYNLFKQSIVDNEKLKETAQKWPLSEETRKKLGNTVDKVNFFLNGRILKQDKEFKQASVYFIKALNENDVVEDVFGNDFINSQIALLNAEINMPLDELKKFLKADLTEASFNTYMSYADLFKMLAPPNASSKEFINYYGEAENYYLKAISIEPNNVWGHIRIGHLYRDKFTLTGNESYYSMADQEYNKAKELSVKAGLLPLGPLISLGHLHKDRAYKYNDKEELKKGIEFYKSALELDKDNIVAYYNLGGIYLKGGQLELAIDYFERILRINPKFVDSNYRLGYAYYLRFKESKNETYKEKAKYYYKQQLEQDMQYGVTDFLERGGIQGYSEVIEQYKNMIEALRGDAKESILIQRARQILIEAYLRRKQKQDIEDAYREFMGIRDMLSFADDQSMLLRIENERANYRA